jgi:hypothetical protein
LKKPADLYQFLDEVGSAVREMTGRQNASE